MAKIAFGGTETEGEKQSCDYTAILLALEKCPCLFKLTTMISMGGTELLQSAAEAQNNEWSVVIANRVENLARGRSGGDVSPHPVDNDCF